MREQLITSPIFVMLRFVMIFVGLGSERELEQLRVLGVFAFHTGTFMLLALMWTQKRHCTVVITPPTDHCTG